MALKSGAALLLDMKEHAHLKEQLTTSGTYVERTVKVATISARNRVQSLTWKGSLDRLCAEATIKLQSEVELEIVYREKEGKLEQLSRDAAIQDHETLLLGPLVLYTPPVATPTASATATVVSPAATATTTTATATTAVGNDSGAAAATGPKARGRNSSCMLL